MLFIENNGFFAAFQFIVKIVHIKIRLNGFILLNYIHSGLEGGIRLCYFSTCIFAFAMFSFLEDRYTLRTVCECLKDRTTSRK